ncbi:hypothetical protein B0A52_00509 [Exophiala mesophila]|uniref:CHL4 family chromosome segregation protein n=1 Tax=Exophiala mesophila TaxID=212818 RepID=A0A438NKA1_EXOME|nr:hypothetical protein B0A52_00509 [Exophiala mesophila]
MASKALHKLSRDAIVDLAIQWTTSTNPYLAGNRGFDEAEEEDYLHAPAEDIGALNDFWKNLKTTPDELSKRDVIDRIVDGDWRRGLTLQQYAMIDMAHLEANDTALRWSALKLVPLESEEPKHIAHDEGDRGNKRRKLSHDTSEADYPHISAPTFLASLRSEISPLVKAHYHLHRLPAPDDMSIIRLFISTGTAFTPRGARVPRRVRHATDSGRVMYIALPGGCPYIYVSVSGSKSSSRQSKGMRDSSGKLSAKLDLVATKRIILEAIPKALSRAQHRWALEPTKLTTKSLRTIRNLKGNGRPGTGGGAYSVYHLDAQVQAEKLTNRVLPQAKSEDVEIRFGPENNSQHCALDHFHVTIQDARKKSVEQDSRPAQDESAQVNLNFSGTDVFHGLRQVAMMGSSYMNLSKVPCWMTGEMGVSSFKV